MSNIVGVASFGLNGYIFPSSAELVSELIPSFVLLPDHHLGVIHTGEFAQNNRLHSGIYSNLTY